MRRVIRIDIHRTFGEVVIWEVGLTRHEGRVDMTRTALEGFGKQLLKADEVVIENEAEAAVRPVDGPPAERNCMAVSRVLTPYVKRVVIANPRQVKAIAHAHVKTDSRTDPDAGDMVRDGKPKGFFYLDHRTVDGRFAIITDTHVTPANVHDSLPYLGRLDRQRERFGFYVKAVGLDPAMPVRRLPRGWRPVISAA